MNFFFDDYLIFRLWTKIALLCFKKLCDLQLGNRVHLFKLKLDKKINKE